MQRLLHYQPAVTLMINSCTYASAKSRQELKHSEDLEDRDEFDRYWVNSWLPKVIDELKCANKVFIGRTFLVLHAH